MDKKEEEMAAEMFSSTEHAFFQAIKHIEELSGYGLAEAARPLVIAALKLLKLAEETHAKLWSDDRWDSYEVDMTEAFNEKYGR